MKHHEREFFVASIRAGQVYVDKLIIRPLTVEQTIQASNEYNKAFIQSKEEGVMDEEEMLKWMKTEGLWHKQNENRLEKLQEQCDNIKVELYKNFIDKDAVKSLKIALKQTQGMLQEEHNLKHMYYVNTCEGIASLEKTNWIIRNTTFLDGELYDFDDDSLFEVSSQWQKSNLPESSIRELSRTEPWRSIWSVYNHIHRNIFLNQDIYELTFNQKNIVIWSKLYDNIHESPDCPSDDIINDDDALDGWFILQNKKRKQEQKEKIIEGGIQNEKIKNSQEIFVMSNKNTSSDIYDVNSYHSRKLVKERLDEIKEKGTIKHHQLKDQKVKLLSEANSRFKNRGK